MRGDLDAAMVGISTSPLTPWPDLWVNATVAAIRLAVEARLDDLLTGTNYGSYRRLSPVWLLDSYDSHVSEPLLAVLGYRTYMLVATMLCKPSMLYICAPWS